MKTYVNMNKSEVENWIINHIGLNKRMTYNTDNYTCYVWENGETYEYKVVRWEASYKHTQIFINKQLVIDIEVND